MGKVTVRWQDLDDCGARVARDVTLEGETEDKIGYETGSAEDPFLRVWAGDQTFVVYESRVIYIDIQP